MANSFKIPGSSWLVEAVIPSGAQKNIEFQFSKGNKIYANFILDRDGDIRDIFEEFADNQNLTLPEVRLDRLVEKMEQIVFDLKKSQEVKVTKEKKSFSKLINLKEMSDKKILISGLAGAGKTSIYQVIFEGKNWWEISTDPTRGIKRYKHETKSKEGYNLFVWDLGGQNSYLEEYHKNAEKIFPSTNVLIFVLDACDPEFLDKSRKEFMWAISQMNTYSPEGIIFCLIHKMDQFPNPTETFDNIKNFLGESVDLKSQKIAFMPTSIMNDSIYVAWEQLIKTIIPKSKKLNILAENLKNQLGIYNVLVLEKKTGFPICASSTVFDDVVLVGTVNKIWESTMKLIRDLDLVVIEKISVKSKTGLLTIEEFDKDIILMLISPDSESIKKPKNRLILETFKKEMSKFI